MNKKFEDVFQECLERIQQGDTVENCLRSYPAIAVDLEIMLRATLQLSWRASGIQPRPEFRTRARAEFIRTQHQAAYSSKEDTFKECLHNILDKAGSWKDRLNRKDLFQECLHGIVTKADGWKDWLNRKDIFQECLERVQRGDTIENCLRSYPAIAADLEIMLRATLNLTWRTSRIQPRPEFRAHARAELIRVQYQAAYDKYIASTKSTIFSLHRAWAPALAVVLILVLSSVGTVAASSNAMPDQPLYSVKIATEQVQLSLVLSDQAKAELNMKFAETRTQEITIMATEGKPEQAIIATEKLEQNLIAAEQAVQRFEGGKSSPAFSTSEPATTQPKSTSDNEPPSPPESESKPAPAQVQQTPPEPEPVPSQVQQKPPEPTTGIESTPAPETKPSPATTANSQKKAESQTGEDQKTQEQSQVTEREEKAEKLKQSLQTTISKNITTLENAQDKAPERSRKAIQRAIELAKERKSRLERRNIGPEGTSGQKSDVDSRKPDVNINSNVNQEQTEQNTSAVNQNNKSSGVTTVPAKSSTTEGTTNTRNNNGDSNEPSGSTKESASSVKTTRTLFDILPGSGGVTKR